MNIKYLLTKEKNTMSIQKFLKATTVVGVGMVSETTKQAQELKPKSIFGCSFSRPVATCRVHFDESDPLNLKNAKLVLLFDSKEVLVIKNPVELKIVQGARHDAWYKPFEYYDKYILVPRTNSVRKKIHDICASYRNCREIHKIVYDSFDVASAEYYKFMKTYNGFPKKQAK